MYHKLRDILIRRIYLLKQKKKQKKYQLKKKY